MSDRAHPGSVGGRSAWRYGAVVGPVLIVALLAYGLSRGASARVDDALEEGRAATAPELALELLAEGRIPSKRMSEIVSAASADGIVELRELRGVPIVLNFWASWCEPCRDEAPLLEQAWRRDRDRGVLYLGLDTQDLSEDALEFIREFSVSYPTIRDPGRSVSNEFGLTGIPETFFIDRRGRIVGHAVGVVTEEILAEGATAAKTGTVVGIIRAGAQGARR